jgi:exosome complex RNA-binding protein Csl4
VRASGQVLRRRELGLSEKTASRKKKKETTASAPLEYGIALVPMIFAMCSRCHSGMARQRVEAEEDLMMCIGCQLSATEATT